MFGNLRDLKIFCENLENFQNFRNIPIELEEYKQDLQKI